MTPSSDKKESPEVSKETIEKWQKERDAEKDTFGKASIMALRRATKGK